jgi:hypothetical protein
MKRQIEFEVEEKNNDVTSANWTSVITGTYGKKNETFQLSRYLTFLTLKFHSNKTKSYLGKVTFTKMNRKQQIIQIFVCRLRWRIWSKTFSILRVFYKMCVQAVVITDKLIYYTMSDIDFNGYNPNQSFLKIIATE